MPEPTAAMKRKMAQLEERADAVAEGTDAAVPAETVSLSLMLGEGNTVTIGSTDYEVAAFPVSKLAKAGKLIAQCPDLMLSAALSASAGGETGSIIGTAQTTETLNRLAKNAQADAPEITEETMAYAFSTLALNITEEEAAAMGPLAVLALSRKHPDITEADIENDLDLHTFLVLLCRIFEQNQALRQRF